MLLWGIGIDDIRAGPRERGLENTLTRRELDIVAQSTDCTLDEAVHELLDILAARIRRRADGRNDAG